VGPGGGSDGGTEYAEYVDYPIEHPLRTR
jgi:hypothetical protein